MSIFLFCSFSFVHQWLRDVRPSLGFTFSLSLHPLSKQSCGSGWGWSGAGFDSREKSRIKTDLFFGIRIRPKHLRMRIRNSIYFPSRQTWGPRSGYRVFDKASLRIRFFSYPDQVWPLWCRFYVLDGWIRVRIPDMSIRIFDRLGILIIIVHFFRV